MSPDRRIAVEHYCNRVISNDSLQDLELGIEQFVRISHKAILEHSLSVIGAPPPEIVRVDCGQYGFKYSVKLNFDSIPNLVGDTFFNPADAESSAVDKAIKFLEKNYMIKICDFSARTSAFLESANTMYLLDDCITGVKKMFVELDKVAQRSDKFFADINNLGKSDYIYGGVNPDGIIYSVVLDNLHPLHINVQVRSSELVQAFDDIINEKIELQSSIVKRRQLNDMPVPSNEVVLPSKMLLDLVLSSFGLNDADYTNSSDPHGTFLSYCIFEFPYMKNFKYGGRRAVRGHGFSMNEAEEEAACKALLFIEKNFITHVIDYNYNNLIKTRTEQQRVISLLERTIKLAHSLESMFVEWIKAIELMRLKFSFDPALFFSSRLARQIKDYHFCDNSLKELHKYTEKCIDVCQLDFALLHKSTWKLSALKINLPL